MHSHSSFLQEDRQQSSPCPLIKPLSYDDIRYSCLYAIIFNNGTKACFDRIVPFIGLMATECLGMPSTASASMCTITKGMTVHIHTSHGSSLVFVISAKTALNLGVLQGSRAVHYIWLSISCVILHALSAHTTRFQVTCPCHVRTSKHRGEAFCWQHQPLAHKHHAILELASYDCNAEAITTPGAPSLCQWNDIQKRFTTL